jgi:hypothetical protein
MIQSSAEFHNPTLDIADILRSVPVIESIASVGWRDAHGIAQRVKEFASPMRGLKSSRTPLIKALNNSQVIRAKLSLVR